jgi:hypothetical protein
MISGRPVPMETAGGILSSAELWEMPWDSEPVA